MTLSRPTKIKRGNYAVTYRAPGYDVSVTTTLKPVVFEAFERAADADGVTRSELLRRLIKSHLAARADDPAATSDVVSGP